MPFGLWQDSCICDYESLPTYIYDTGMGIYSVHFSSTWPRNELNSEIISTYVSRQSSVAPHSNNIPLWAQRIIWFNTSKELILLSFSLPESEPIWNHSENKISRYKFDTSTDRNIKNLPCLKIDCEPFCKCRSSCCVPESKCGRLKRDYGAFHVRQWLTLWLQNEPSIQSMDKACLIVTFNTFNRVYDESRTKYAFLPNSC